MGQNAPAAVPAPEMGPRPPPETATTCIPCLKQGVPATYIFFPLRSLGQLGLSRGDSSLVGGLACKLFRGMGYGISRIPRDRMLVGGRCVLLRGGRSFLRKEKRWFPTPLDPGNGAMPRSQDNDSNDYRDLCVSCAKRSCCTISKSEGGVWHCEEYVEC